MKTIVRYLSLTLMYPFLFSECKHIPKQEQPNVILFLVDDMGWTDAKCLGSHFYETPAIDQLASEGMRFTNAYSAHPVSGPSRACLLSGKAPLRLNNTNVNGNLSASEKTIAESMKEAGYTTFFAGKWHVGTGEGQTPLEQGFDYATGLNTQGQPGSYFYPYKDTGCDLPGTSRRVIPQRDVKGLENGEPGEYLTDRLTDETVNFIKSHKGDPFFVFLSHYAVHTPLEGKKEYIDYYNERYKQDVDSAEYDIKPLTEKAWMRTKHSNPIYASMIKSLDESLAKVMNILKETGLDKNTIIIFSSDNGGVSSIGGRNLYIPTCNAPLKNGKGWMYEGGIRIPTIIKYPGHIEEGSVSDYPICLYDFYPTILDMTGQRLNSQQHVDGISLLPVFKNEILSDRKMYWYYPHQHSCGHMPGAAMRDGDFKLVWKITDNKIELYNLKEDLSEQNDLSEIYPEKATTMKTQLENWINTTAPQQNPVSHKQIFD